MKQLSERDAYAAMFAFLEQRYMLTGSNELGALLGSMSLMPDGGTADPAIWHDWLSAVDKAVSDRAKVNLQLR